MAEIVKEKRFKLFSGLAGLFVGFVMWFMFSAVYGINEGITGQKHSNLPLATTFAIMILVPFWYWILRIPYVIGKEKNNKWLKIVPVVSWWFILAIVFIAGLSKG